MQGWNKTAVRTEKIIVEGRVFDAPLVLTRSGEILPMIVRFPETGPGRHSAVPSLQKRHDAADALISSMHLILSVPSASKKVGMEKAADEIVKPALQLTSDAIQLYMASRGEDEVQRLCVLITRQVRMGLLALRMRRGVFRALKRKNPNIIYRRFTRFPKTDENGSFLKDSYGRTQIVTELTRHYRRRKNMRRPRGHVYEIIQSAATVGMPAIQVDQEPGPTSQGEEANRLDFVPIGQGCDAFEDLCRGYVAEEDLDSGAADPGLVLCYGDEPHLCCALPSVVPPSAPCCETELHNLFVSRWEPWGTEETSALVASAILLQDGALMCERMLCYGLNRRTYGEMQGQTFRQQQEPSVG